MLLLLLGQHVLLHAANGVADVLHVRMSRWQGVDAHEATGFAGVEANPARGGSLQGEVAAQEDIHAWVKTSSALADDDVAGLDGRATGAFGAEELRVRLPAVLGSAASCFRL